MKWELRALADCASFFSGGTPNKGRPEYWGGAIPWVSSGEMTSQFIKDTTLQITEEGLSAGSRLMPEGTIFAVVRGMSLATEFRVSYATAPMAFNQDLKALVAKEGIDPYFLFSALRSQGTSIRDLATEAAHGTKKLEMERLQSFQILVPDLDTQTQVAKAIRNYDDLIENNRRRIALLEESARLLYREWFVNLRFPGFEAVPLTLGVPEGWCKAAIAEQTTFLNRGITPAYNESAPGLVINQKCIRDGRLSMLPARRQSKEVKPERLIQTGDVLINSTGAGTLGRVAQVRSPVENCTVDTHVTIVRPIGKEWATYFGQALINLEAIFSGMGKGSTNQLELSRNDIGAIEIWRPPIGLAQDFHELVWPMLEQAETLLSANQKLVEARDALLPKLMSGEIQV